MAEQCPRGHKHLSGSPGDEEVHCWDCHSFTPVPDGPLLSAQNSNQFRFTYPYSYLCLQALPIHNHN
jgi:hypothetical protein